MIKFVPRADTFYSISHPFIAGIISPWVLLQSEDDAKLLMGTDFLIFPLVNIACILLCTECAVSVMSSWSLLLTVNGMTRSLEWNAVPPVTQ